MINIFTDGAVSKGKVGWGFVVVGQKGAIKLVKGERL